MILPFLTPSPSPTNPTTHFPFPFPLFNSFAMEKASSAFAPYAYSVVHTNCLTHFSHTRELGHNMGAHQDQQYSEASNAFAYGYQNCVGNMP